LTAADQTQLHTASWGCGPCPEGCEHSAHSDTQAQAGQYTTPWDTNFVRLHVQPTCTNTRSLGRIASSQLVLQDQPVGWSSVCTLLLRCPEAQHWQFCHVWHCAGRCAEPIFTTSSVSRHSLIWPGHVRPDLPG
jgi:hypothetical protein